MRIFTLIAVLFFAAIAPAFALPFDDGLAAYKKGDWAKAYEILKPIADADNSQSAVAQERIAHLYERGNGVPKDMAAAAKWFQKSAAAGNPTAAAHLGRLYRLGLGVPKSPVEASRWSIKGASQGNAVAESNLGYMALEGMGGPVDASGAAGWFKRSAEQGDASAMLALGGLYEQGKGVPKDVVLARKWYLLASVDDGEYDAETFARAKKAAEALAGKMTPAQVEQGTRLAADFKPAPKH
jgi:TPR repeat protein